MISASCPPRPLSPLRDAGARAPLAACIATACGRVPLLLPWSQGLRQRQALLHPLSLLPRLTMRTVISLLLLATFLLMLLRHRPRPRQHHPQAPLYRLQAVISLPNLHSPPLHLLAAYIISTAHPIVSHPHPHPHPKLPLILAHTNAITHSPHLLHLAPPRRLRFLERPRLIRAEQCLLDTIETHLLHKLLENWSWSRSEQETTTCTYIDRKGVRTFGRRVCLEYCGGLGRNQTILKSRNSPWSVMLWSNILAFFYIIILCYAIHTIYAFP